MDTKAILRTRHCASLLMPISLLFLTGCPDTVPRTSFNECQARLIKGEDQIKTLERDLVEIRQANRNLQEQIGNVRQMKAPLDELVYPVKIQLVSPSGGFGEDKPYDTELVLYIQPVDKDGDVIKASGTLSVKIFDLQNPPDQTLFAEYDFDAAKTRSMWYGRLWTRHFTVHCPWPAGKFPAHNRVTAQVTFTDLLTGRPLTTSESYEIRLPGQPATATAPAVP